MGFNSGFKGLIIEFSYLATHMNNEKPVFRFVLLSKSVTYPYKYTPRFAVFRRTFRAY